MSYPHSRHCSLENGAEVIVMLALVAVDTTSSSDLRHLAAISIDHVGQKLSPDLVRDLSVGHNPHLTTNSGIDCMQQIS